MLIWTTGAQASTVAWLNTFLNSYFKMQRDHGLELSYTQVNTANSAFNCCIQVTVNEKFILKARYNNN